MDPDTGFNIIFGAHSRFLIQTHLYWLFFHSWLLFSSRDGAEPGGLGGGGAGEQRGGAVHHPAGGRQGARGNINSLQHLPSRQPAHAAQHALETRQGIAKLISTSRLIDKIYSEHVSVYKESLYSVRLSIKGLCPEMNIFMLDFKIMQYFQF